MQSPGKAGEVSAQTPLLPSSTPGCQGLSHHLVGRGCKACADTPAGCGAVWRQWVWGALRVQLQLSGIHVVQGDKPREAGWDWVMLTLTVATGIGCPWFSIVATVNIKIMLSVNSLVLEDFGFGFFTSCLQLHWELCLA